jgi:hypothetical protein
MCLTRLACVTPRIKARRLGILMTIRLYLNLHAGIYAQNGCNAN